MAETYTVLAGYVRERAVDCPTATAIRFLGLELRDWCHDLPLHRSVASITPLVAGTREYAVPFGVVSIEQVFYELDADTETELDYVAYDERNLTDGHWRYGDNGAPSDWYLNATDATPFEGGLMIGFDPAPDTATSGTYPRVRYHYLEMPATDPAGSDESPDTIYSPMGIVYGALARHFDIKGEHQAAMYWRQMCREEKSRQYAGVMTKARYESPKLISNNYRRRNSKI